MATWISERTVVMPWVYHQATGHLFINTIFVGAGYSGHGSGLNDPAAQDQPNVGPIPAGSYTIGPAHTPVDHLGPMALPLVPDPSNQMHGRFGFFMHGDNQFANHSASDGCIVIGPDIRRQVTASGEHTVVVISGDAPQAQASVDRLETALFRTMASQIAPSTLAADAISEVSSRAAGPVNAYPELPILPFERTSVTMDQVVRALNEAGQPTDVKRASYVMFRNESGNGAKGINNNYCGAQGDSGRWPDLFTSSFAGTVTMRENGTQHLRIFMAFKAMPGSLDFLMNRVTTRGLFIGGQTHLVLTMNVNSDVDLARAYHKEWVTGSATSEPSAQETASFLSMYRQAEELIA